ncbi:MAG: SDR family oxidoreductase [Pseudomonadota bacterium]
MATASFDYSGHAVLVTGGSNGIGHAIARAFAEAGADVTITGTRASVDDYQTDLSGLGYRPLRVEDATEVDAFIAETGALDVLVNNAGNAVRGDEGQTPEGFELNMEINLNSVFRLCQGLRSKLAQRPGAIVNIASMTSYLASPRVPGYGASKAAVLQLTKTLGELYAPDGIRVNAIAPGWIETNLTQAPRTMDGFTQTVIERTPMRRWGRPQDLAGTALYLASADLAGFVTGVTIPVDGGYIAC